MIQNQLIEDQFVNIVPTIFVLSQNQAIKQQVLELALELDLKVTTQHTPESVWLVDPTTGFAAMKSELAKLSHRPKAAVILCQESGAATFYAISKTKAQLIQNPLIQNAELRSFMQETVNSSRVRKGDFEYPYFASEEIVVVDPLDVELVQVSPYGARLKVQEAVMKGRPFLFHIEMPRNRKTVKITSEVMECLEDKSGIEILVKFIQLRDDVPHELFRMAKAHMLRDTMIECYAKCLESQDPIGYRWEMSSAKMMQMIQRLIETKADLLFARINNGRLMAGQIQCYSEDHHTIKISVTDLQITGLVGKRIFYSCSVDYNSYIFSGWVLNHNKDSIVLTAPTRCVCTNLRESSRLPLGLGSKLKLHTDNHKYPIVNLAPSGICIFVPKGCEPTIQNRVIANTRVFLDENTKPSQKFLVCHRKTISGGVLLGCRLLPPVKNNSESQPIKYERFEKKQLDIQFCKTAYQSKKIFFNNGPRKLAGRWNQISISEKEHTLIIIPPQWGRTKETSAFLAQFICASFHAQNLSVAVLRIDYSNGMGESEREPRFDSPGLESLGMDSRSNIEDIHAAINYGHCYLQGNVRQTILIGMSFTGPLCLRCAVENEKVTGLVELMGASDIQDLIRTASGGIDYVSRFRAGLRNSYQNVLGVLLDVDRWLLTAVNDSLVNLSDIQNDAARLKMPLLWVLGDYDAYINKERVEQILRVVEGERCLVETPCSHVPMRGEEAFIACSPVIRFLLERSCAQNKGLTCPHLKALETAISDEWSEAPKSKLPSPQEYWKTYMSGTEETDLGFEILAMTQEYSELMTDQIKLLNPPLNAEIYDLGGGLGHILDYLDRLPHSATNTVHLLDFATTQLTKFKKRAERFSGKVISHVWNAMDSDSHKILTNANYVMMSLFLSCLENADIFLERLFKALPAGAQIVASSVLPDADLSMAYARLLNDITHNHIKPPEEMSIDKFRETVRNYMNSAAWLLRLSEEGHFELFDKNRFSELFQRAGFKVREVKLSLGSPSRAVIINAYKA